MKNTFNLLKPQRAPDTFWEKFYVWAMTVCRYIVVFVEIFVIGAFFYRFSLDRNLNDTKDRVQNKIQTLALYKDEEIKLIELDQKLTAYDQTIINRGLTNAFYQELLTFLPTDINDMNLSFSQNNITIGGEIDEEILTQFESDFKSSKMFTNVILATREKTNQQTGTFLTFEFSAEPIKTYINTTEDENE